MSRSSFVYTHYCWEPVDGVGFEHCTVAFSPTLHADGIALGVDDDGASTRVRYLFDTDEKFRTRTVHVQRFGVDSTDSDATLRPSSLSISASGDGSWAVDGESAPELDGCLDVDLAVTPLTNTLPIRRLALEIGESATSEVVYLDPRTFEVSKARQQYTRLARDDDGGRYRYESLTTGFTAEVDVDTDGVVCDYPGVFRRVR
ncbi:putative glycolipid-binding domain-containing protein [Halorussus halophilus]|uniref:putative glycolipid-binding domain-containing protein n=1 Tax=Halorussus halophilus TaxID=2650975 RepID=UPI00130193D3|nr:putative glycolipid-binding domain-containing protein [Halorussus halophilus]